MTTKKSTRTLKTTSYWRSLLKNYKIWPRLWLENFEISEHTIDQAFYPTTLQNSALIKAFTNKHKMTINHVILAAWGLLLHRYSSLDDVVYWLNDEDRHYLIRSEVADNTAIIHYIQNLKKQIQTNYQHAPTLQADIKKTTLNKIFYFASDSQNIDDHTYLKKTRFNLGIIFSVTKKTELKFFYNPKRFSLSSMKNIAEHFHRILQSILDSPEESTTRFEILTANETMNLLNRWNNPKLPIKENACAHELFSYRVKKNPQRIALSYDEKAIAYQELDELSNQLAHLLLGEAVTAGDIVAVLMDRTPEIIIAMLAIFKIGAVYLPINPKFPDHRIHLILNDCRAKIILANNNKRIPEELIYISVFYEDSTRLTLFSREKIYIKVDPNQVAYIVYTTGSTERTKGVMIKHKSLVNLACYYQQCFNLSSEDRSSQFSSQAFDTFFCETIPFLIVGASVHMIDDHIKLNSNLFISWLASQQITICDLPTAYAQILLNESWPAQMALRILKVGGDPLTHLPIKRHTFDLWNTYGPTEATIETTFAKVYEGYQKEVPVLVHQHNPPPIGKPIPNAEVYVVDSHMQPVPVGVAGEMLIGGIGLSAGYLHREHLTEQVFIKNLFSQNPQSRLYKTGDLVRWLDDGNLQFIERIENQINMKGFRVELTRIESSLSEFPEISEVIVIPKDSPGEKKKLIACLVPNLNKIRIPYHVSALLESSEKQLYEVMTEDLSKEGISLSGVAEKIELGKPIRVNIKLPGLGENQWLTGHAIWQVNQRVGIQFFSTTKQTQAMDDSIKFYLSTHNLMEILQTITEKRNFREALKNKLPAHLIPEVIGMIPKLHLSFNGKIDWRVLPTYEFEKFFQKIHVSPETPTEIKLADLWTTILGIDNLSMTESFFELGASSLQLAELFLKIEKTFHCNIPLNVLLNLPYLGIIAEYIDSNGEKYLRQSPIQQKIRQDILLPEDIIPPKKINTHAEGILLTGAAGFLGIHTLIELLNNTDKSIYCLIRKRHYESANERLQAVAQKYQIDLSQFSQRLFAIDSDLGYHKFGMSSDEYEKLADNIFEIYHLGAQVNQLTSYDNLRMSNVTGTLEIIKFATYKTKKSIHYVSTFAAATLTDSMGNYVEDFPPESEPFNLIGGYAQTKWVAERLLTQIMQRGLIVSIFRCGLISGNDLNGVINPNDTFDYLLKGCIQLGYAPDWDRKITILPVDFTAHAIVAISENYKNTSKVIHLDHPQGLMWQEFITRLNEYGYKIQMCEADNWIKYLKSISKQNVLYPFIPLYSQTNTAYMPYPTMSVARRMMNHLKIEYPLIDNNLLRLYFDYLRKKSFFPEFKR